MKEVYAINPDLDLLVVDTANGEKAYRKDCKKLRGEFYVKDKDCYEVDGKWYRTASGLIVFDHELQRWVLKNRVRDMVNGVVDFDAQKQPVKGLFTPKPTKNVTVTCGLSGLKHTCISEAIALKVCKEDVSTGDFWYNYSAGQAKQFNQLRNAVDNKQKGYNIEDNVDEMQRKTEEYNKFQPQMSKNVIRFSKLLNDITFGMEIECIRGYLPEHMQYQTGVVVCRDGSLHDADGSQGPEFTTIPLTGAKGVQSVINLCNFLNKRTVVDKHCSFHIHLGNLPTSRQFLVCLYRLAYMIQDEVFAMFPYYKNDEKQYAGKDKNYCKKLNRLGMFAFKPVPHEERECYEQYISYNYTKIFSFLSGNITPGNKYNRKKRNHPKAEKWNRAARYHWINLMNVIFSNRNTVEFRIHTGTTNAQKVITWLFICNAIVKTAILRAHDILKGKKITLNECMEYYSNSGTSSSVGGVMTHYLVDYIQNRKDYFRRDFERADYLSEGELKEDKNFYFDFPGVSEMFK